MANVMVQDFLDYLVSTHSTTHSHIICKQTPDKGMNEVFWRKKRREFRDKILNGRLEFGDVIFSDSGSFCFTETTEIRLEH